MPVLEKPVFVDCVEVIPMYVGTDLIINLLLLHTAQCCSPGLSSSQPRPALPTTPPCPRHYGEGRLLDPSGTGCKVQPAHIQRKGGHDTGAQIRTQLF